MADNAALAGLMARPQATENYVSIADMMRNRQLAQSQIAAQQQQIAASQTGQGLTQEQTRAAQLENQQRQIQLQDQQRQMEYWANPEKYQEEAPTTPNEAPSETQAASLGSAMTGTPIAAGSTPQAPAKVNFAEQMLGLDSADPLAKQANGMIRAGVMPQTVTANAQALLGFRTAVLKQTTDKQAVVKDGLAEINKILAPIGAEQDQAKRTAMLQAAEPELQKASQFDPSLHQAIMQADAQHVDKILNLTGGMQDVLEYGTKQEQEKEAKLKTEPPTDAHIKDAVRTIASYPAIPDPMKAGFAEEIKNAPTIAALEKIQDRADKASESFQRSADARAQAETMADIEKRKAVQLLAVKDDQELTGKLANSQAIRGLLNMSAGGNQQATQDALVRFAEHEVVEGGVKRFNETELNALGSNVGTKLRQLEAWKAKNFEGKLPAATNAEIQKVLDFEDEQARGTHNQNISTLSSRMGVNLEPGTPKAGGNAPKMMFARDPQGKLHFAPEGTPLPAGWKAGK